MSRKELTDTWALSQIEAAADGSLGPEQRQRMERAMAADSRLRESVERARRLRGALASIESPRVPNGLLGRLLAISSAGPASKRSAGGGWPFHKWALAPVALSVALVVTVLVANLPRTPEPEPEGAALSIEHQEAVQEFYTAMAYVRHSAVLVSGEVADQVGYGFQEAFDTSRNSLLGVDTVRENGD